MALLVSGLIDDARAFHPDFTKHVIPDPMALAQLARFERQLYDRVVALNEEAFSEILLLDAGDIEDALADNDGYRVGSHRLILSVIAQVTNGQDQDVTLVPHTLRNQSWGLFPCAYLIGDYLHLCDQRTAGLAAHGWEGFDGLEVVYVPSPTPPTTVTDSLTIDENARDALTLRLVQFMATRVNVRKELDGIDKDLADTENAFLSTIAGKDSTTTWRVKQVR